MDVAEWGISGNILFSRLIFFLILGLMSLSQLKVQDAHSNRQSALMIPGPAGAVAITLSINHPGSL